MPLERRCKQNLLTLQATCSFVFDYSTRRLLDLLSKASPAGGIPLGGTVTFSFCTLALGQSEVGALLPSPRLHALLSRCMLPYTAMNLCMHDVYTHHEIGAQNSGPDVRR